MAKYSKKGGCGPVKKSNPRKKRGNPTSGPGIFGSKRRKPGPFRNVKSS